MNEIGGWRRQDGGDERNSGARRGRSGNSGAFVEETRRHPSSFMAEVGVVPLGDQAAIINSHPGKPRADIASDLCTWANDYASLDYPENREDLKYEEETESFLDGVIRSGFVDWFDGSV
ncbi:hypothetical protein KM043_002404 [Ampulex compressa]|nr:hypothetical protein KM043_002404 [Ampulex compressa]